MTSYKESGKSIPTDELLRCSNMTKYDRENEIKRLSRDGAGSEKLYLKLNTPVMCTMNVDLENGIYNVYHTEIRGEDEEYDGKSYPQYSTAVLVLINKFKLMETKIV